jgi:hypothetical protein
MVLRIWRRRTGLVALLGLIAISSTATLVLPLAAAQDDGSTIVTVELRVLTREGRPILDLKPEEVALKVGGRVREVVALEAMVVGGGPGTRGEVVSPALPPPFVTNESAGGGREITIVVDDEAIGPGREEAVRGAVRQLLSNLSPADRVAWLEPKNAAARVHLTNRHDRVTAAAAALVGRANRSETAADAACRTRTNIDTLLDVLENVAPSASSVVLFLSNGLTAPAAMESLNRTAGPAGPCDIATRDLDALAKAAAASRAILFAVQVVDDTTSGAARSTDVSGGLEHIAGLTGNPIVRLIGETAPLMKRIADETSAYYLAAFQVPAAERNGSTQRVEVNVARQGAVVRAWPDVVIPKPIAAGARGQQLKPREMLTVSKEFRGLGLRASVRSSRASEDGKPKVVCVFEPSDPSQQLTAAAVALFDAKGLARAQWTGQPNALRRMPVMAALNAPPAGTYRLRVAATSAGNLGGTIDQDITIEPVTRGTISVGALTLGVQGDGVFLPRLQFTAEPVAYALVEIYDAPKTANLAVAFEIAGSADGPAAGVVDGTLQAPREDLRLASAGLPVGRMTPGEVVIRAVITVDGKPLAVRPTGTLRKVER